MSDSQHGGARPGAGRRSNAELGLPLRSERVLARFTPGELAQLRRDADADDLTLAELVAQRALAIVKRKRPTGGGRRL